MRRTPPILLCTDEMLREGLTSISQLGMEKFPVLRAIPSTVCRDSSLLERNELIFDQL